MKPATWYLMMIIIGFFYIYLTAIQYIRGQDIHPLDLSLRYNSQYAPLQYSEDITYDSQKPLDFGYHNYEEMTNYLRSMSASHPNLTALYSIGRSVQGRELWVLVVSSHPYDHIVGQPNVKYVANMHGNEAVGRELLLHLIEHFVLNYRTDPYIRWLLDNTRIHILPSMNPDGFELAKEGTCTGGRGRYNAQGFDLNRNFPDYFKQNNKKTQPEAEAIKQWISKIQFVLSANLHGGALVASYPFDNSHNTRCHAGPICSANLLATILEDILLVQEIGSAYNDSGLEFVVNQFRSLSSLTPDHDVFKHLAEIYAFNHASMHLGLPCKQGAPKFPNGTTNGAAWYPLTGGMQDYHYVWQGCMDITLELSCCKYPPSAELEKFWEENRKALVRYLGEVHRGVRGFIKDEFGNPISTASLKIQGRDIGFQSTKYGEYWRILLPGIYKIEAFAEGLIPREEEFVVVESNPTLLNITLYHSQHLSQLNEQHPTQHFQAAPSYAANRLDTLRMPIYVGGPGQKQGAAPSQNNGGGITGIFNSIGERISSLFSVFG